ncbi:MAG: hypothetical protein AAGA99_27835 [Actinomycetota bacterium]
MDPDDHLDADDERRDHYADVRSTIDDNFDDHADEFHYDNVLVIDLRGANHDGPVRVVLDDERRIDLAELDDPDHFVVFAGDHQAIAIEW